MTNGTARGPKKQGHITVRVSSKSVFLSNSLPVEIRDHDHALVESRKGGGRFDLPDGLYSVTALLDNGARETKLARVRDASSETLVFHAPPAHETGQPIEFRKAVRTGTKAGPLGLIACSDGLVVAPRSDGALQASLPPGMSVSLPSWIVVETSGQRFAAALPLSKGEISNREVVIEPRGTFSKPRIDVSLAPGRRVARALREIMRSGKVGAGLELAESATELLRQKYSDPVGATYGALMLHRFDALGAKASWLENLANDFEWLVDGRILLAATLSRKDDPAERARGLTLLLDAMARPPTIFSEAFSLGLALLRRYPGDGAADQRAQRLRELSRVVSHTDFAPTFSTLRMQPGTQRPWERR